MKSRISGIISFHFFFHERNKQPPLPNPKHTIQINSTVARSFRPGGGNTAHFALRVFTVSQSIKRRRRLSLLAEHTTARTYTKSGNSNQIDIIAVQIQSSFLNSLSTTTSPWNITSGPAPDRSSSSSVHHHCQSTGRAGPRTNEGLCYDSIYCSCQILICPSPPTCLR